MFTFDFDFDGLAVDPKCMSEGMWVVMDYSRRKNKKPPMNAIVLGQLLRSDDGGFRVEGYGFFAHTRFEKGDSEPYKYISKSHGDYNLATTKGKLASKSGAPVYTVETWKGLRLDWEKSIPKEFWTPMIEGKGWLR